MYCVILLKRKKQRDVPFASSFLQNDYGYVINTLKLFLHTAIVVCSSVEMWVKCPYHMFSLIKGLFRFVPNGLSFVLQLVLSVMKIHLLKRLLISRSTAALQNSQMGPDNDAGFKQTNKLSKLTWKTKWSEQWSISDLLYWFSCAMRDYKFTYTSIFK